MPKTERSHSYQHKLAIVFTVLSLLIALISVAAVLLVEHSIEVSTRHTRQSLEEVSLNALSATLGEVSRTVDYLSTYQGVLEWLTSDYGSADYYYSSLMVYKELGRWTPSTNLNTYSLAITRSDDESFVISQSGTMAKNYFLESIQGGFDSLPTEPSVLLSEDASTILLTLNRYLDGQTLVFYCCLPSSIFAPPEGSGIAFAIVDSARHSIMGNDDKLEGFLRENNIYYSQSGRTEKSTYSLRTSTFPYYNFTIVFAHSTRQLSPILAMGFVIVVVVVAAFAAAYRLQQSLYAPVKEAYERVKGTDTDNQMAEGNEFDMIIAKCKEAEDISTRLESLSNELQTAMDVQKYRSYIRGMDSPHRADDDETSFFTVAILDAGSAHTLLLRINSMARKIDHLHFILMDNGNASLIYKYPDEEECHSFLYKQLREFTVLDEDAGMQAAISHTVKGWVNIRQAYRRAQSILDSRYWERDRTILTEADVSLRSGYMRYPVSEERKLVNAALAASPTALEIFDAIVDANLNGEEKLTESEFRNLASALTSTVMRIGQEMRLPQAALESEIQDNPQAAISEVRKILAQCIEYKSAESQEKGDLVAEKMKRYIHEHYSEPIMLIDLSEEFNLTPKYCSEIFNRFSGDNFKNYLNRYRINMAQQIINEEPNVRITALASRVGFSSSNTFIRVFDRYMGVTPKQYAESISKAPKDK